MVGFQHIAPPLRLFAGADSLGQLGRELDRAGCSRAAIVCGASLSRDPVLLAPVRAALGERWAGIFAGVRPHSPREAVEAGAEALRTMAADAVIAVGGGSAIVTARAASILLAEDAPIERLATTRDERGGLKSPRLQVPKLPQFVIPTTPTTAMVKAGSAVFDPARGRLALFDPKTRAQAIFLDPAAADSAPASLVLSASLDTLSLAIEGLMSRAGDPISDALLMHAIRLIAAHLSDGSYAADTDARMALMLAAVMCGQGTDHAGAGAATVLGHAIGADHVVENGIAKTILLPHVLRFNEAAAAPGLGKITIALGLPGKTTAEPVIGALARLSDALALPRRLRDVGIPADALATIATRAMDDWFLRGNPRPVREPAELQQVLDQAW